MNRLVEPEFEQEVQALFATHQKLQDIVKALNRGHIEIFVRQGRITGVNIERSIRFDEEGKEID